MAPPRTSSFGPVVPPRYYFDTEFDEPGAGHPINLISIGIVDEEGREYYAESSEFDPALCNSWVQENVLPYLTGPAKPLATIASEVLSFVNQKNPEFWAKCGAYDWVILCQLLGSMSDLPEDWPHFCFDIKQHLAYTKAFDVVNSIPDPAQKHNALSDAHWNRDVVRAIEKSLAPRTL